MSDTTFPESWPEGSMNHVPSYRRRKHDAARAAYSDGRADRPPVSGEPRTLSADEAREHVLKFLPEDWNADVIGNFKWRLDQYRRAIEAEANTGAALDWQRVFRAFANAIGVGITQEAQDSIRAEYARLAEQEGEES